MPSTSSQVRPQVTSNANMEDEGRGVESILTRSRTVSRGVTELWMQITFSYLISVYNYNLFVSFVTVLEINSSENYDNAF